MIMTFSLYRNHSKNLSGRIKKMMLMFFPFYQHHFFQRTNKQGAVAGNIATAPCRFKKPSFIKAQFLLQCSFRGTGAHRQTRHK